MLALAFLIALAPAAPPEELPATRLIYLPGRFVHLCPGEVEVQEGVSRRLGSSPFAEPAERLVVLALEGDGDRPARARMELFDARMESMGARVLDSPDGCDELVQAAELAISIALAPTLALAPEVPAALVRPVDFAAPVAPPIEPRVDPALADAPPEDAPVAAAPVEDAPYMSWMPAGSYLRVGGGAHASWFIGPAGTVGAQLAVALRSGRFELVLEQKQELPAWHDGLRLLHGSGVNALLACGELTIAGDVGAHRIGVVACASASSGSVWTLGDVIGLAPYAGIGGRLAGSWTQPDGSVLRPWAQLEWAILRPAGFYADQGQPWPDDAPVSVALGLSYEVAWGR